MAMMPAAFLLIALLQSPGAPVASVEGVVMRAGTPVPQLIANARVELFAGPSGPHVVRTGSGGRFIFHNVTPGTYRLQVFRDGFIRQEYAQRSPELQALRLTVEAGEHAGDVVFALEPAPTIAGWVRNEDSEPVAGVMVYALRNSFDLRGNRRFTPAVSTRTDDRGEYRLYWLDPGDYYVSVASAPSDDPNTPEQRSGYAPTFYPGTNDPSQAGPIRLEVGRDIEGVGFWLSRVPVVSVSGTITNMRDAPVAIVTLTPAGDGASPGRYQTQTNDDGTFQFEGVTPGAYVLSAVSQAGPHRASSLFIDLGQVRGAAYDGIRLALGSGLDIPGRVFIENDAPADLAGVGLVLRSVDGVLPDVRTMLGTNGEFLLSDVPRGSYLPSLVDLPGDMYLKAALSGETPILDRPLEVIGGRSGPLALLLSHEGGRLSGVVSGAAGQLTVGATVLLMPDSSRRDRPDHYRVALAGPDGEFSMHGIPPGSYILLAVDYIEPNAWLNENFMRRYEDMGTSVTIAPGQNGPVEILVTLR